MNKGNSWLRWRRIFRQSPEREVEEELRFHVEERVREYVARGLDPETARQSALQRLGDLERVRSECAGLLKAEKRADEQRRLLRVSSLDVKLGVRILLKYPGLSLVAGLGMAFAIGLGAGWFGFVHAMFDPTLPLHEGERVISIRNRDVRITPTLDDLDFSETNPDRQSLHDFFMWRGELESVQDLAAFRSVSRNLVADGTAELVRVAEMTASGFEVARVAPVLGRPLVDNDEGAGAPPVVVIAYEEWQRRFEGDPDVLGRQLRLGNAVHTVVGVMPAGFRFPIQHRFWVPLRLNPLEYERGEAPSVNVFGRLVDGVTMDQAQAELTTIGRSMAVMFPDSHENLRPRVMPYAYAFFNLDRSAKPWSLYLFQHIYLLLLILVAVNVAILIYARTVTRRGEIAVRSALGASRWRVVAQLFLEGLVLSLAATAIGLMLAGVGLAVMNDFLGGNRAGGELPFWVHFGLSLEVVTYAVGLVILASVVVGVLPALKVTGRRVQAGLQLFSSRGSPMQLGCTWTALIVTQVAITVAGMPGAIHMAVQSVRDTTRDLGYPADEFVRARLSMGGVEAPGSVDAGTDDPVVRGRLVDRAGELFRRLEAEPAVSGVTFASRFPGTAPSSRVELEAIETPAGTPAVPTTRQDLVLNWVPINQVDVDLFSVFGVPILAGRGFVDADTREGSRAVIVNRAFAERIGAGGNVLGRRVRTVVRRADAEPGDVEAGPWCEIVGVVADFPTPRFWQTSATPRLYQPVVLARTPTIALAVRVRGGDAPAFVRRLSDIAVAVDPTLQLHDLESVATVRRQEQNRMRYGSLAILAVTLSILLLCAAGIYALMSFTVSRRRREIGIRSALGADARRILAGIFARATAQLLAGVLIGLILAAALNRSSGGELMGGNAVILLTIASALMMVVGLLAALGPARRGLAIEPTEALREE